MTAGVIFLLGLALFIVAQVSLRAMAAVYAAKDANPRTPEAISKARLIGLVNLLGWILMIVGGIWFLIGS